MRPASLQLPFGLPEAPQRHRVVILALVVLLHALLLLLLLRLGALTPSQRAVAPITVDLIPAPSDTPEPTPTPKAPSRRIEAARPAEEPVTPPDTTVAPPVAPRSSIWSQVMPLTRDQMAATDRALDNPPRPARDGADAGDINFALSGRTDDSSGPGSGPNGETLYNARWLREPTNAELNAYLPPGAPRNGWGIIACRTIPGNRVEDCHEIGQSPGSGLAGAVRRAAWQFRILPPRINGRPIVGEWVRIRIDYIVREAD